LQNPQLAVISGFEATGIVENITLMTRKGEFEIDVMFAALNEQDRHDQPSARIIRMPNLYRRIELNLDRR
jgi:hypothetical protein